MAQFKKEHRFKKHHIAFAIYLLIFKILIIGSLIYIAYSLVEIKTELELTKQNQQQIETQIDLNQQNLQSQIVEISNSLLTVKKDFTNEILQEFNRFLLEKNPVQINEKILGNDLQS